MYVKDVLGFHNYNFSSAYLIHFLSNSGHKDSRDFPDWVVNILLIRVNPGGSTIVDFSFTVSLLGVCIALLLVCMQYSLDCKEYALQKYHLQDGREARETYFRSFIGTAIYGHLTIAPKRVPTALKYGMILFTEILYFGNLPAM